MRTAPKPPEMEVTLIIKDFDLDQAERLKWGLYDEAMRYRKSQEGKAKRARKKKK